MNSRSTRAFALPLVILLTLVVSVLTAAMLGRQYAQSSGVSRQKDRYSDGHWGLGIREVVDHWLKSMGAKPIRESLGIGGKGLEIELADGTVITVYLRDAQDTLMAESAALSTDDAADLKATLDALREEVPSPAARRSLLRRTGPAGVSLGSGRTELLKAIGRAAAGPIKSDDLYRGLIALRDRPKVTQNDLNALGGELALEEDQKRRLSRLVHVEPSLWYAEVQSRAASDGRLLSRYGGLVLPPSVTTRSRTRSSGLQGRTQFLTWERLEVR